MSVSVKNEEGGYKGFFRLDVYTLQHHLYNGAWSQPMKREVFERGHSVGVMIWDSSSDSVLLTEQFRLPAYLAGQGGWQTDVVAGKQDKGEAPEETARREAVEECGVEVDNLYHISTFMPSQGDCTEKVYLYCAEVDLSIAPTGLFGEDEYEDIQTSIVSVDQAWEWVRNGKIKAGIALVALQWLQIKYLSENRTT